MADADLSSLLGSLAASPQQPPLAQLGSALAGLGAGLQGQPNPVLQQQEAEFRQRARAIQLGLQVQGLRERKENMAVTLYRDLLSSPSPEGRKVGAEGIARHLQTQGQPVSPGFVQSFEAGTLSLDQRKQAYISILAGGSDEYLEKSLNVPKPMVAALRQEAQSPAIHKLLYGKTPIQEQLDLAKADRDERRFDLLERRQDLTESKETRQAALAQKNLELAQARLDLSERKFDWMQAKGPEEKRLKALDQADLLANQLESTANQLNKLGYLPPPNASILDPQYLAARGKRVGFPNEPAWVLWRKHLQPAMVGYARAVQNDIGPRAIAAFQAPLSLMDNPPDLESIRTVVKNMRKAIELGRKGEDTAQFLLIKKPDGAVLRVPWKRGMSYGEGDLIVGIE